MKQDKELPLGTDTLITKSKTSIRSISLPKSIIPKLRYFLDITPNFYDYIFEDLSIDGLSSYWTVWQKNHNFNQIRFQDIRHTHASILLYMGVDLKVISERLGHSDIGVTEKNYIYIIRELKQKITSQIDAL
ncbi:MAG: tyrosine-type recombinase/integrase [Clostridia bacterium]|nr:tyrosine-type recombinase/integrase [Clostridia bacterium]